MGAFFTKTVVVESRNFSGIGERIEWILRYHFRGILGTIICFAYGLSVGTFNEPKINVPLIMNIMAICYLLQPVMAPVVGMMPLFLIPMTAVLPTVNICYYYFTEDIVLIFLGGILSFVLNNTGLDRRLIMRILAVGKDVKSFKPAILLFKACIAAFFTSFFGNHLYASALMYEYLEPIFGSFQIPPIVPKPPKPKKGAPPKSPPPPKPEYKYHQLQHVVNQAIVVSSILGHLNIIHTSWTLILMRGFYYRSRLQGSHQDLFNYFSYMAFSLPFTFAALCLTIIYFTVALMIVNWDTKPISSANLNILFKKIQEAKKHEVPPLRTYQFVRDVIALVFLVLTYALMITRRTPFFAWADLIPVSVSDATVAAGMIIIYCAFPRHFGFLKIFSARKKSELDLKPESALLFWRFVDKAVNYGYFYVMGGGITMMRALIHCGSAFDYHDVGMSLFNSVGINVFMILVAGCSVIFANIASPIPILSVVLPCVLVTMVTENLPAELDQKTVLVALCCALSSSFNYLFPFKNTCTFHRYHLTRTKTKHVWPHALILTFLHTVLLLIFVLFYGPVIWPMTMTNHPLGFNVFNFWQ